MSCSFPQINSNSPIGGRYRIICQLGAGGFGQTFLAEDIHLPDYPRCVVKQLKPQANDSNSLHMARRCFNTEAQALYQLGVHDQIPRLLAHFEENQEFYLVQEFIEGEPLSKELVKGKPWMQGRAIALLQDILQVLAFVHQHQVIHRDLKPSNLMRRKRDYKIVLIDFGAVKQAGAPSIDPETGLTNLTISIGTHGYMPNEQVAGKPRFSSDVYAVGMLGIQALTGINPRHLGDDVNGEIEWHHLASHVSRDLLKVIDRMVRYDFRDRYPTAIEALEALNKLSSRLTDPIAPLQSFYYNGDAIEDQPTEVGSRNVILQTSPSDFTTPDVETATTEIDVLLNAPTDFLSRSSFVNGQLVKAVRQTTPHPTLTEPVPATILPKPPIDWSEMVRLGLRSLAIATGIFSIAIGGAFYWLHQSAQRSQMGLLKPGTDIFTTAAATFMVDSQTEQAIALVKQADQLRLAKQYAEALQLYNRAIALKQDYVQAYWGQCDSLNGLQRPTEAINACDSALSYDPYYAQAVYGKANAYSQELRWAEALELYERATRYKPDFAAAWVQQGVALQRLGRSNEALTALSKGISLTQNSADAWVAQAEALFNLKRFDEAIAALDKALQIQPDHPSARQLRDRARQQLER
jgi:serine/threonine protein kinase